MRNDRTKARKARGGAGAIARKHVVSTTLVGGFSVCHRTAYGNFVGNFGGVLEVLTEVNARYLGLDALEGSAVLKWGVGLGVPGLLMSHSTG